MSRLVAIPHAVLALVDSEYTAFCALHMAQEPTVATACVVVATSSLPQRVRRHVLRGVMVLVLVVWYKYA